MGTEGMGRVREEVRQSKSDIRRHILGVRDSLPAEARMHYDEAIRERVLCHAAYRSAQVIFAYASYKSEVGTMPLIRQALADGKDVFLPRVSGDGMEFWRIVSPEDLQSGYRGIPEPLQNVSFTEWVTGRSKGVGRNAGGEDRDGETAGNVMMWMPGAVFDRERHRIGYGGGFYDRYLSRAAIANGHSRFVTAALAYTCQVLQQIPYAPHDIKPDMVITETGIL